MTSQTENGFNRIRTRLLASAVEPVGRGRSLIVVPKISESACRFLVIVLVGAVLLWLLVVGSVGDLLSCTTTMISGDLAKFRRKKRIKPYRLIQFSGPRKFGHRFGTA